MLKFISLAVCKVFMLKYALVQNVQAPFPIAFDVKYWKISNKMIEMVWLSLMR